MIYYNPQLSQVVIPPQLLQLNIQSQDWVSGFKVRAIRIKDTADRSQRIQLNRSFMISFNAGFFKRKQTS